MSHETVVPASPAERPLTRGVLAGFSLPAIMLGFMHAPEALVQGIYAKFAGVSLAALAGAVLFTRMFDAVTYPLIGWLSDRTTQRWGTRKPWILAGTVVTAAGLWFLYRPPLPATTTWYTAWFMVAYIGWKMTEIPYGAWSVGLTQDFRQRSRVQAWRGIAVLLGTAVFFATPYLAKSMGLSDSTELNLQSLSVAAMLVATLMPLFNLISLWTVPEDRVAATLPGPAIAGGFVGGVKALLDNTPFLYFGVVFVVFSLVSGMATGVAYLYFDVYLGIGPQLAKMLAIALPVSLLGIPLWGWLCGRFERHRVWAVAIGMSALSYLAMGIARKGYAPVGPLTLAYSLTVLGFTSSLVAAPAMLADIVDYGRWRTARNNAGLYSALYLFIYKSLSGIGGGLGLAIAAWFGFEASATEQTANGALGIKLVAIWITSGGLALSAIILFFYPLTRAKHAVIAAALRQSALGKAEDAPALLPTPLPGGSTL